MHSERPLRSFQRLSTRQKFATLRILLTHTPSKRLETKGHKFRIDPGRLRELLKPEPFGGTIAHPARIRFSVEYCLRRVRTL